MITVAVLRLACRRVVWIEDVIVVFEYLHHDVGACVVAAIRLNDRDVGVWTLVHVRGFRCVRASGLVVVVVDDQVLGELILIGGAPEVRRGVDVLETLYEPAVELVRNLLFPNGAHHSEILKLVEKEVVEGLV